jgi:serine/threonine protein kinase/Tol biopolymer transport system component
MIGTTIAHYTIESKLGEGGMGVVYKARDTKLDRDVALKFLPDRISTSPDDLARFTQEAKAAAALNHPNICTIHGIEESEGRSFIVMEYVDGQMLEEKKHSLTQKQAVEIGIQIAEGLAAAHEKGIVHRDIKPENIMIRKDGRVQVMDFGLAKFRGASRLTKEGSTVGTAGYMSPEQVQGHETDHRSDLFSLGVLLYEMFAGQPPFKGMHETAISYEIVNVDPAPMVSIRPEIPPELDAIVLECLEKDPNERTQSALQVAIDLKKHRRSSSRARASRLFEAMPKAVGVGVDQAKRAGQARFHWSAILPWVLAIAAIGLAVASLVSGKFSAPESIPTVQALIPAPPGVNFHTYGWMAGVPIVSPDGSKIAFVGVTPEGKTMLWLRRLDSPSATPLQGTEGAYYPFWSYDSKWLAFSSYVTGKLKKIDVAGNPPVTICDVAVNIRGGAWGRNDVILIAFATGPLFTVPASGGTPTRLLSLDVDRKESSQRWPVFLPDGKHFLYFSRTVSYGAEAEGDAIMAGSLDGGEVKLITASSCNAAYGSGYLLFMRGSSLLAQPFNENTLSVSGEPRAIAEGVLNDPGFSLGVFSLSENGVLAYQTGNGVSGARMAVVDRSGRVLGYVGEVIEHYAPRLSPDGTKIVESIFEPKSRTQNLWLDDLARGSLTRFTTGFRGSNFPVWSPDGQTVVMTSTTGGIGLEEPIQCMVVIHTSAGSPTDTLYRSEAAIAVTDWSPDGKAICFDRRDERTQLDIMIREVGGDKKVEPFLQTPYNERSGRFSPDGHWVAYQSDETGEQEIYLRPYPGPGTAIKVSASGGTLPVWRHDGRELFFVSKDNKMMAAETRIAGTSIEVGEVRELFTRTAIMSDYDVFPDGRRLLLNRLIEPAATDPLTIVDNWTGKLKQ